MPRKTLTYDDVRELAHTLPDIQESSHYGVIALKLHGVLLACTPTNKAAEPDSLMIRLDFEQREALLAEAPEIFYLPDHYKSYPSILVRLSQIRKDQLRDLLTGAHRFIGTKEKKRPTARKKPKPAPQNASIDKLLQTYPEPVQTLARAARETLREWLPNASEAVDESAKMLAYSHGTGYQGMACTLLLSKTGVKLGIAFSAALPDPRGLLAGAGKLHRHVPLRVLQDLQQPGLKQLVKAANAACHKRLAATEPPRRANSK
ncbi:MAG TPA: hypothetical protein VGN17_21800 [Bryobacteraceae bacterium]|jgi:hypothetical protein